MSSKLINDEEFLKIKKDLDDIFASIDKVASSWIDIGNAISGIGIMSASLINPLLGLGVVAASRIFVNIKKKKVLEDKKKNFMRLCLHCKIQQKLKCQL